MSKVFESRALEQRTMRLSTYDVGCRLNMILILKDHRTKPFHEYCMSHKVFYNYFFNKDDLHRRVHCTVCAWFFLEFLKKWNFLHFIVCLWSLGSLETGKISWTKIVFTTILCMIMISQVNLSDVFYLRSLSKHDYRFISLWLICDEARTPWQLKWMH